MDEVQTIISSYLWSQNASLETSGMYKVPRESRIINITKIDCYVEAKHKMPENHKVDLVKTSNTLGERDINNGLYEKSWKLPSTLITLTPIIDLTSLPGLKKDGKRPIWWLQWLQGDINPHHNVGTDSELPRVVDYWLRVTNVTRWRRRFQVYNGFL